MIRIVFSKTGYAKYISHLDLTRCMARMFARADVPIWYTEGFNPHPYMVFSAALPIGVYGENELLDIKLNEKCDFTELLDRMNKAAPEGISFKEIYESDKDFKFVDKAIYKIEIPEEIEAKFGFLVDAYKYGAAPHGGCGIGLDRLAMIMCGAESLRDVVAFPKVQNASELMSNAPGFVDEKQLEELAIKTVTEDKEN